MRCMSAPARFRLPRVLLVAERVVRVGGASGWHSAKVFVLYCGYRAGAQISGGAAVRCLALSTISLAEVVAG